MRNSIAAMVALLMMASSMAKADGGAVLFRRETDRLAVTMFGSPSGPGVQDVSVLVQDRTTLEPLLDAAVGLTLIHEGKRMEIRATHEAAQNKLLYAASAPLDQQGDWTCQIAIQDHGATSVVAGVIPVHDVPSAPERLPLLLIPPVWLALFALHHWRKGAR